MELQKDFALVLAHPRSHRYDLSSITLPRVGLTCLDYLNGIIPRRLAGYTIPNPLKYFGYEEVILGLDRFTANFDLIHVPEQSFHFAWHIAKRKAKIGYKMITMQDEVQPFWYRHRPAMVKRAALVRRQTDVFIARSERAKCALICEGVEAGRIRVIGHGVDMRRFHPGPRDPELCKSFDLDPDRLMILFVGRLVWTKGISVLADAAKLLLADPAVRALEPLFLVVGDGAERTQLLAQLRLLGMERWFRLLGSQPYDRLPDLHRLADIFVLPSLATRFIAEQFGMVLIESMATAKPVISTYCGAIDEVVGEAGLLVPAHDYVRLYEALLDLCLHEDRRLELGERGYLRVRQRFTHHTVSAAIADAYREVLQQ